MTPESSTSSTPANISIHNEDEYCCSGCGLGKLTEYRAVSLCKVPDGKGGFLTGEPAALDLCRDCAIEYLIDASEGLGQLDEPLGPDESMEGTSLVRE